MEKELIKKGEVIGFQTDTVWGLGCIPEDIEAVDKIYEIKNRDRSKPLILMSHDFKYLEKYIWGVSDLAKSIMQKHFPGAITLIFKSSKHCPTAIQAGFDTVGIRIPNSKNFFEITKNLPQGVLATTSLNISNEEPAKDYDHARKDFSHLATIIKPSYNETPSNEASTVVLCTENDIKILRQGAIKLSNLGDKN